ncbi:hypothetical protein BDV06DRAFT_224553 [Aspergillus oleicola]
MLSDHVFSHELTGNHTVSATLSTSDRIYKTLREDADHKKVFLDPGPLVTARRSAIRFSSDVDWEPNLYRHPKRQWLPEADYIMQHGIYSFGNIVCKPDFGALFRP